MPDTALSQSFTSIISILSPSQEEADKHIYDKEYIGQIRFNGLTLGHFSGKTELPPKLSVRCKYKSIYS